MKKDRLDFPADPFLFFFPTQEQKPPHYYYLHFFRFLN